MPPRLALTGASGFLGRRLAASLAARGWDVRALMRRPVPRDFWDGAAPECVIGDLADDAALARLADGAEVVVHAAGLIKARTRAEFFEVNASGAERMARAARGRMILVSSLAAREPSLSDYAASKRAGEDAARNVLGDRVTIVRPPAIYGPGDRAILPFFRLAAASPVLPVPAMPRARLALAYVDDAAREVADFAESPPCAGPFAMGGDRPEGYAWTEILAAVAAAVGRRPPTIPLPPALISAAGAVSETLAGLTGRAAVLTRGKARELRHPDWSVAPAEMAPNSDSWPRTGLGAGLARTVTWYRTSGWL
jgi:nucleoside-diphosphate-sugar epimerase